MDDLREIKTELRTISETLIRNTATLEIHVARTEMAEKRIESLEVFNRWSLGLLFSGVMGILVKLLAK